MRKNNEKIIKIVIKIGKTRRMKKIESVTKLKKSSKNKRAQVSEIGAISGVNGQEMGREETEIEKRVTVADRAFSNSLPSYMPFLFHALISSTFLTGFSSSRLFDAPISRAY